MATNANQLAKSGKFGDLRRRLVFLLLALVVYRIGAHIPCRASTRTSCSSSLTVKGGLLNLFNMFSGGALSRFTVFAWDHALHLGVDHLQLMTYVVPTLEQLKKEGESGRRKITQYTRYATWAWPLFQSRPSPSRWSSRRASSSALGLASA